MGTSRPHCRLLTRLVSEPELVPVARLPLVCTVLCRDASHQGQGLALPTSPTDTGAQPSPPSPHLESREGIPRRLAGATVRPGWVGVALAGRPRDARARTKGSVAPLLTWPVAISLQPRSVARLQKSGLRVLACASSLGRRRRGAACSCRLPWEPQPGQAQLTTPGTRMEQPRGPQHLGCRKTTLVSRVTLQA